MTTYTLYWESLLHELLRKTGKNGKIDADSMPRIVECGIGGNFGLHIRDLYGYKAVRNPLPKSVQNFYKIATILTNF